MRKYSDYLKKFFPGQKIQKISIDAGFTCPNRDGTLGTGGCIYCRNDSFTPGYCNNTLSVSEQLIKGKEFFKRKYKEMKFLAYFQSYSNTYNKKLDHLRKIYYEAVEDQDIVGLVVSTRPDTVTTSTFELLGEISERIPVFLEIGAETSNDETLNLINRNHKWEDVEKTVNEAVKYSLHCGLHLIAGLPGEDTSVILNSVSKAVELPIETIKLHQLQILKDTILSKRWENGELNIKLFTLNDYLDLCIKILKIVPERIIIERFISQSPPDLVIAPKWNIKNYQFMDLLANKLTLN